MQLNGSIMSGDTEVAKVVNNSIVPVVPACMPVYLQKNDDIEGWLCGRAIDGHRTNSRLLKKALRLTTAQDAELVLRVHAATITDNFWYKPQGENLTYADVKFKANIFDRLALYGDPDSFNMEAAATPELTNIGSYEKCWRLVDGKWWIYKQGNDLERFSELFISLLGTELGFDMAQYALEETYIKSPDFTDGASVNFEAMASYVGEDEDYETNFNTLLALCAPAAKAYVEMIFLDTVCFNMDRHTKNYGVLRDIKTGEVLKLAPNFDNNIALISRGYPKNIERKNDKLIQLFRDFINGNEKAREYYFGIEQERLTKLLVLKCAQETGIPVEAEKVADFILAGKRILEETIR